MLIGCQFYGQKAIIANLLTLEYRSNSEPKFVVAQYSTPLTLKYSSSWKYSA